MRKHKYHMTINNHTQIINTKILRVHLNIGLRSPSRGIGCLTIQIMEITIVYSPLCLPLRAYINNEQN